MLAVWRVHGMDVALRRAWDAGVVLCGISAGMICWFEGGVTDSFGPLAPLEDGLRFLTGTACPHYDGETNRRPTYHRLIAEGTLAPGWAAADGVGLHFVGTELRHVVASRPRARAYRVELREGHAVEREVVPHFLG
jgi:peptidase E